MALLPNASHKLQKLIDDNKDHPVMRVLQNWITNTLHKGVCDVVDFNIDEQPFMVGRYSYRYVIQIKFKDGAKHSDSLYI